MIIQQQQQITTVLVYVVGSNVNIRSTQRSTDTVFFLNADIYFVTLAAV